MMEGTYCANCGDPTGESVTVPMICKGVEYKHHGNEGRHGGEYVEWLATFVGQYVSPAQSIFLRGRGECPYTTGKRYVMRVGEEADAA
jgi:hypothetical protein